jgi:ABC-2 type transport system ATP-binding protein
MRTVIEVEGLQKRYGAVRAVDGVSFTVGEGEILGILGSNGAGKTTAIECLQGLRAPDAGRLRVLGRDPRSDDGQLRSLVGSQLQDAALPERIRVHEALELFADTGAVDTDDLMRTWGLALHRKKAFATLSGGLRQRLFIALALLNRPQVVFFDELTQGLDPSARREVWDAIRLVRSQGTTVVLVTHFMEEAEALCDRLAIFEQGRIIAQGSPAAVVAAHADTARSPSARTAMPCTSSAARACAQWSSSAVWSASRAHRR